jgi:undecaprenyl-phosphate 4-deoxy-4-formamido-L-arabinose transferase
LRNEKNAYTNLKIIRLSGNFGQHAATLCGLKHAQGQIVVTMDDDLEHAPEDIPKLVEQLLQDSTEVVYGIADNKRMTALRNAQVTAYKKIAKTINNGGKGSSFRAMNAQVAKALCTHNNPFVFIDEYILWHTKMLAFCAVTTHPSKRAKSAYRGASLWRIAMGLIMISSTFPLKMVTYFGFALMSINFVVGMYFIVRKLFFSLPVEGYASLIVSILFSTGLLMLGIGIIAQYMSKLLLAVYGKPAYREAEII